VIRYHWKISRWWVFRTFRDFSINWL
jgi:hypothetical protein